MCGIVGLQLRDDALVPQLGGLLTGMLAEVSNRGPDSAGVAVYGDTPFCPAGMAAVSVLASGPVERAAIAATLGINEGEVVLTPAAETTVVAAAVPVDRLVTAVRIACPDGVVSGHGERFAVLKGVGFPTTLAESFGLAGLSGWQGLAHTRMATESAITPAHCHPFAVAPGLCLVHNGSFANHATIRRELQADGVCFDSDNDSEVGARFVASRLAAGDDLDKALRLVCERFDGFYTLLVTTPDSFAVVRDAIACKPALIAETPQWVAMASEYGALATLPGIEDAHVFEPIPEEVYLWSR